jgi:antitoxin ParD1/3/4
LALFWYDLITPEQEPAMSKAPKVSKRTISLSQEQAAFVDAKVASGDYASVSEVIRDGLRIVKARDDEFEHFLRTKGVEAYDLHMADPSSGIPIEDVLLEIEARYQARITKAA